MSKGVFVLKRGGLDNAAWLLDEKEAAAGSDAGNDALDTLTEPVYLPGAENEPVVTMTLSMTALS
jgi:hypothetical protein